MDIAESNMGLEHVGRFLAHLWSKIEPHIQMRWLYFVYSRSDLETVGIFLLLKSCAHGSCMQLPQMSTTNGTTNSAFCRARSAWRRRPFMQHLLMLRSLKPLWLWRSWLNSRRRLLKRGGGKIGEGQVGDRMFYLSNPVMHASDELLPTLSF